MPATPSPRKNLPALIGILFAVGALIVVLLQIVQLWQAQAPLMPNDMGARERIVSIAEVLEKHNKNISIPLVQLLVTTDRNLRIPLYKQIDQASDAAEQDMKTFAKIAADAKDFSHYKDLEEKHARYRELFLASVDELETSGAKGTLEQFWGPTREALHALELSANQLASSEREKLQKLRQAEQQYAAATQRIYLFLAALIALSIGIGVASLGLRRSRV